ncbi:MAG: hypothetical protein ACLR6H_08245 [Roseburia sp.]
MGRAKIIYTVDPDHFKADTMEQFILGGMDIARCVCMQKEKEEQSRFVKQVGDFFQEKKKSRWRSCWICQIGQKLTGKIHQRVSLR